MIVKHHYSHAWTSCRYALGIFYETDNEHSFFDEKEEKLAGVAIYGYPVGARAAASISDDGNADDWEKNCSKGIEEFIKVLEYYDNI